MKYLATLAVFVFSVSTSFAVGPTLKSGDEICPNTQYLLSPSHAPDKCMDVQYGFAGADVRQWDCNGQANQRWTFSDVEPGFFVLQVESTHQCLEIYGHLKEDWARVAQWDCHKADNQRFALNQAGPGLFQIVNQRSGKCLEIIHSYGFNGANVTQITCDASHPHQLWSIRLAN